MVGGSGEVDGAATRGEDAIGGATKEVNRRR